MHKTPANKVPIDHELRGRKYLKEGDSNPDALWNAPKCLQEGAAHPLLEAAGFEQCWNCREYFRVRLSTIGTYSDYVNLSDIWNK